MICAWCGDEFEPTNKRGPHSKYCRKSHRQRAYEHRVRVDKAIDLLRDEGYVVYVPDFVLPSFTKEELETP